MNSKEQIEVPGKDFFLDLDAIRQRAREHLSEGAVTADYRAARAVILRLLNDALATEIICVLRYKHHQVMSANQGGIAGFAVTRELGQHAAEEQEHADKLAKRIVQLGGEPDLDPLSIAKRSHTQYVVSHQLKDMLIEDLVAERIAIETYSKIIRYIGDKDPTTRRLLENILEQEEEHADELSEFVSQLNLRADKPEKLHS